MAQNLFQNFQKDYYSILGINKEATQNDIKKAYYSQASKYHPVYKFSYSFFNIFQDKNSENKEENTQIFQQISQAYEVLSNNEKRQIYNYLGQNDFHSYNSQNNNFKQFFNAAFEFKFKNTDSKLNKFNISSQKNKQINNITDILQQYLNDSSSDEEEDESTEKLKQIYDFYQKKNKINTEKTHCHLNSQKTNIYIGKNQSFYQNSSFHYSYESNNFSSNQVFFNINMNFNNNNTQNTNSKENLNEKINFKKPVFKIQRNVIRKQKINLSKT